MYEVRVPAKASVQHRDSNQGASCCEATVPSFQFMVKYECYEKLTPHANDVYHFYQLRYYYTNNVQYELKKKTFN